LRLYFSKQFVFIFGRTKEKANYERHSLFFGADRTGFCRSPAFGRCPVAYGTRRPDNRIGMATAYRQTSPVGWTNGLSIDKNIALRLYTTPWDIEPCVWMKGVGRFSPSPPLSQPLKKQLVVFSKIVYEAVHRQFSLESVKAFGYGR
jgi:hypothetical protein